MALELPVEYKGWNGFVPVADIGCSEDRARDADLSAEPIADLAESISRDGLLQRIGVRKTDGPGYLLVWGRRRLEAFRLQPERLGATIDAIVYPAELPQHWADVLEIDENAQRQDLTPEEEAAHTVRLAAVLKELEEAGVGSTPEEGSEATPEDGAVKSTKPEKGKRGRPKRMAQKVAEHAGKDHKTIRRQVRRASAALGERVDLDKDTPDELKQKAERVKRAPRQNMSERPTGAKALTLAILHLDTALPSSMDVEDFAAEISDHDRRDLHGIIDPLCERLYSVDMALKEAIEEAEEAASA